MNLEPRTLQILKNFSAINPSIHFKGGEKLATISPTKSVMAIATLPEPIEEVFAIYDLSRFLGVLSLFENPELELNEKVVTIRGKNGDSTSYTCGDPSNFVTPPDKELKMPKPDVTFSLKEADYAKVMKALSVLGLPEVAIVGDGEKVYLQAVNSKNPTGDVYRTPVGETEQNFRAVFNSDNLRMIPGDYDVEISKQGMAKFEGTDLLYYIAIEAGTSTFD